MRSAKLISIIAVLFVGCFAKTNNENKRTISQKNPPRQETYFEYDEIDHYFNNLSPGQEVELYEKEANSELDQLKFEVIVGSTPNDSNDLKFIEKLESIGYTRKAIPESKFPSIDEIFRFKSADEILTTSCIQVYRDILIFKKSNEVVGVAKICFDCWGHHIVGARVSTSTFGQNGDFERLFKLIRI